MKKIKSVIGKSLSEKAKGSRKLSKVEMEYELDHCSKPWECPEACYQNRIGCFQKNPEGDENGKKCC